jgi:hypothetical protein
MPVRIGMYLEQASIAFANAAVAVDMASRALRYAFAADINCRSATVPPMCNGIVPNAPLPNRVSKLSSLYA